MKTQNRLNELKKVPKWFVVCVGIAFLLGTIVGYSQIPTQGIIFSSGIYPGAPSYTIWREGSNYFAKDAHGHIDYSGTDASQILINALGSLPSNGGKILLIGTIIFTTTVPINRNSVEITGENTANDHYFTRDGTYHGITNKAKTVIIADGITAFHIGSSSFNFGISLKNMLITGISSDVAYPNYVSIWTSGAGINITRGNTITIENVQVTCKQYGIYAKTGVFAWDKVIDILHVSKGFFSYNEYGIYSQAWIANSHFQNIYGYLNEKGLIHGNMQYDVVFDHIVSQNDNWKASDIRDNPIYVATFRDITFNDVTLLGDPHAPVPASLMFIDSGCIPHWGFGARITLNNFVFQGTNGSAISIDGGGGNVYINNAHFGSKDYSFYGNYGQVKYYGVYVYASSGTNVSVNGGWIHCSSDPNHNSWFQGLNHTNQIEVSNIQGLYDGGKLTTPYNNVYDSIGLQGNNTTLDANTEYTINGIDLFVNSAGGSGVSITIKDAKGNTIASGLSTLTMQYLPKGYILNFGGFSSAPTVTFHAVDT